MARIFITGEDSPPAEVTEGLWLYNALDSAITLEVLEVILPQLDEITSATYAHALAMQAPILEMECRGVRVDKDEIIEATFELEEKLDFLQKSLEEILLEGVGLDITEIKSYKREKGETLTKYMWNSPAQLKEFFYNRLGLPPVKVRGSITVDRKALEKLRGYFYAEPIINHILAIRDISKKLGVLRTGIDRDGRIRTSYNIAGTDTGRLSSYASSFGSGCVRPTAQALTPQGWKSLANIADGDLIAQWDKGEVSFVNCTIHRQLFSGSLLRYHTEQVDLAVTPGHRTPFWTSRNKTLRVEHAADAAKRSVSHFPLGGKKTGGTLAYPSWLAMLMADFSIESSGWRGAFKKERKQKRFLELAAKFEFAFTEQKHNGEGYRRFYVPGHKHFPTTWGPWILDLSPESAAALLEEARHWDAHDRGSGFIFFTADPLQARWFCTLAHIAGKSATIRREEQNEGSYSDTVMYWVNVKDRDFAVVTARAWSEIAYEGEVCCPQVPSSFWLVRENGFISVTGNTNLQNITGELRRVFVADPGYKLCYIDLEQAESRAVGAIIWNILGDGRYLDFCESGDLHTNVAKMTFKNLPWNGDPKHDKEIAKRPFYRDFNHRDACKRLGHGSNYGGKPPHMSKEVRIPLPLVTDFQREYFGSFPGLPAWHLWVRQKLLKDGWLTTFMGRRRWFFGRRWEDETVRAAIAYEPQSAVADYLNRGLLSVWRASITGTLPVQLLLQVHDAIVFQYPAEQENEIVPKVQALLEIEVPIMNGRSLKIPTEAMVGWNWGYASERNAGGLVKFNGNDTRKRPSKVGILDRRLFGANV